MTGETATLILTASTFCFNLILLKNIHRIIIFVEQITGETAALILTASTFRFNLILSKACVDLLLVPRSPPRLVEPLLFI